MLKLIPLSLLLVGSFAFAKDPLYKIPSNITCVSKNASKEVKSFTITNITSESPESTIADTSFEEASVDSDVIKLGFSNECDNSYTVVLFGSDLQDLNQRKVKSATGLLTYSNGDMEMTTVDHKTTTVTCTLPK